MTDRNIPNDQQCDAATEDGAAFWLEGRIKMVRCTRPAKWVVSVNPPNTQGLPEKVRLCDLCNQFKYHGFTKEALPALRETP